MSTITTMAEVIDTTNGIVSGIRVEQLDDPSPCADWTVRELLAHITAGSEMFTEAAGPDGCTGDRLAELTAETVIDEDFAARFASTAGRTISTWSADPTVLERTVVLPFGELPGEIGLQIAVFDVLTHAWDLDRATGQSTEFDPQLSATALGIAQMLVAPEMRDAGLFGPEQPVADDAHPVDKLAAFTGRRP